MSNYKVIFKRVISEDGRSIAEVKSEVITSGDFGSTLEQSVTVHVSASGSSSTSSSFISHSSSSSNS